MANLETQMDANQHLVALTPQEMPAQQQALLVWCDRKIQELTAERSDLTDQVRIAKSNQWAFLALERLQKKTEARINHYRKIHAAVEAGYLIVPNFDIEVMAVRVSDKDAPQRTHHYASRRITDAAPEPGLPPGEGRYVDDNLAYEDLSYETPDPSKSGTMKKHSHYRVTGYQEEIDFPVLAVKPIVMDATARAMALKVFDRIGVVTGRKVDPIVLGQIVDPRTTNRNWPIVVSFFVAWWLDPKTL